MSIAYTPRTETVVILQGDDEAALRQARAKAESLDPKKKPAAPRLLSDASPDAAYAEAAAEADRIADEANERGIKVVMRSLGRRTWRDLVAKHPPRENEPGDDRMGVNADTFGEEIVVACMVSPEFGRDADRDEFLDNLSEAQFGLLENVAWSLNTRTGADPKARLGSQPSHT
jgi:hypothetical protein